MSDHLELRDATFSLVFELADRPKVTIEGVISMADPTSLLNPYFEKVHAAVVASSHRTVYVDLRRLEFLTSSAFKSLVHWVRQIEKLPVQSRYEVYFLANHQRRGQLAFLNALCCFAPNTLRISPDPAGA